ncbi:hypothetical protein KA005_37165, partial [bacterium]|nr:hypothetical protein [bacterium]
MTFDQKISLASLVINFISFVFLGVIAFLTLRFTAKPKLKIGLKDVEKIQGSYLFGSGQIAKLRFYLSNKGHFYAKPAIINVLLYINFHPSFDPIKANYGSVLELDTNEVHRGKHNSKYLVASGIKLYHKEPGEEVVVQVKTPSDSGIYKCWIAA